MDYRKLFTFFLTIWSFSCIVQTTLGQHPETYQLGNQNAIIEVDTEVLKKDILTALQKYDERWKAELEFQTSYILKKISNLLLESQQQAKNESQILSESLEEVLFISIDNMLEEVMLLQKHGIEKLRQEFLEKLAKLEAGQSMLEAFAAENGFVAPENWHKNFSAIQANALAQPLPTSCEEAMKPSHSNGVYLLKIPGSGLPAFYVNCKRIKNAIWTIVQRREDGSVDFYRGWQDYKHGFGNLYGEFWLGLERMHYLTTRKPCELLLLMGSKNGTEYLASYKKFEIANEANKYKLNVGNFSGEITDSLILHNGREFATKDCDDCEQKYCATEFTGAWWFNNCLNCHLNGLYNGENTIYNWGIGWHGVDNHLKYAEMAIRQLN